MSVPTDSTPTTPEQIKWVVLWLKHNPKDWARVLELANLHETCNWFPEAAPLIRLRRFRIALEDVMRAKADAAYLAAGEYFYDTRLWDPNTFEQHPPEEQEKLKALYNGYNELVQEGCHHVLAVTALRRDQPELWPVCPLYGGINMVEALLKSTPGWENRLGESSPLFDRQLAKKAKKLIVQPWFLPFETKDQDAQDAVDFINQAIPAEMPSDSEILASYPKGLRVTFESHSKEPQPYPRRGDVHNRRSP